MSELQSLKELIPQIQKWENNLDNIEEGLDSIENKTKIKRVTYDLAEHNLSQIEDNLNKFEQLMSLFEDGTCLSDDFPRNLENIKELTRKIEDFEFQNLEINDSILRNEDTNLKQLAEIMAYLQSEFLIYFEQAKAMGFIID